MRYCLSIFSIFSLLIGCASINMELVPLGVEIIDKPDQKQIDLVYKNNNEKTVCLSSEDWPNQAGKVHYASEWVSLVVNNKEYAIEKFNVGSCPNGCGVLRILQGKTITATVLYEDFNLPEELYFAPKKIQYRLQGYFCTNG